MGHVHPCSIAKIVDQMVFPGLKNEELYLGPRVPHVSGNVWAHAHVQQPTMRIPLYHLGLANVIK